MRGNTLDEVAALANSGVFTGAVFAPAFPSQGRFTQDGRHWVGAPHRPDAPVVQKCTDALIQAFARHRLVAITGPADMPRLHRGQVWIPDVLGDPDLRSLVAASRRPDAGQWLWCGSAGLAVALAQEWQGSPTAIDHLSADIPARAALAVTASRHPVLREQMRKLPAHGAGLIDLAPAENLPPEQAANHLAASCKELVRQRSRPNTVVVVGGDTLLALCQASGASHLMAFKGIRPGWGRARIEGGLWHGATLLSRSGAFGAPDDIAELLAQLASHTSTESIT